LAGNRAFRFSRLAVRSSANSVQRASAGGRRTPGVTATRIAGLPLQSLPEQAGAKKISFPATFFNAPVSNGQNVKLKNKKLWYQI
jgi:hypothetical protein